MKMRVNIKGILFLTCLVSYFLCVPLVFATQKSAPIKLTPESAAPPAISADRILKADFRHRPPEMVVNGQNMSGPLKDIIEEAAHKLGFQVQWRIAPFSQSLAGLKSGEVDIVPRTLRNEERETFVNYLGPISIQRKDIQFLIRKSTNTTIENYEDLKNLKIGTKPKTSYFKQFDKDQTLQKIPVDGDQNLARLFVDQKVDTVVVLDRNPLEQALAEVNFHDYGYASFQSTQVIANYFGMSKNSEHTVIYTLLNETLLQMTASGRIDEIYEKYDIISRDPRKNPLNLTAAERKWLRNHPGPIRVHNEMDWPPFNFNKKGIPQGLSIDYMDLLSRKAGIPIKYVTGPSWDEFLDMLNNKELDVVLNIVKTEDRQKYILYTPPYIRNPNVIVSLASNPQYKTVDHLSDKTVAIPKGFYQEEILTKKFPEVKILTVKDVQESLKAVMHGKADATISEVSAAQEIIAKNLLTGLRLSGELDFGDPDFANLRIGVRNDWPVLLSILTKAMDSVTTSEMSRIRQKWLIETVLEKKRIILTDKEKLWLAEHPVIQVGGELDWAPFDFVNKDGQYQGLSKDIMELIAQKTGLKFNYVTGQTWVELMKSLQEGELSILPAMYQSEIRDEFTIFTEPYFELRDYIFMREDAEPIKNIDGLANKKVAIIDGYAIIDQLKSLVPELELVKVNSLQDGVDAVLLSQADAYVDGYPIVSYHLAEQMQTGLTPVLPIKDFSSLLRIGISKKEPILAGIVNKGLADITNDEHRTIRQRWFAQVSTADSGKEATTDTTQLSGSINPKAIAQRLTPSATEKAWLAKKETIRARVGAFPPFQFWDKGQGYGISVDYLKTFCEVFELDCEFITGIPWSETIKNVSEGKDADVILHIHRTPEREQQLAFTDDYIVIPRVIFTRNDSAFVEHINDLVGKEISIEKGYMIQKVLANDYPNIKQRQVNTTKEALELLSLGKVDAYIGALTVASFIMQKNGYTNIKVAAPTHYGPDVAAMAVRKDWPHLASLLDRFLKSLKPEEKSLLSSKWLSIRYEQGIKMRTILKIGGVILLIVTVILFWNRRMAKEISERKRAEQELTKLSMVVEQNPALVMITDKNGTIEYVNPRFSEVTGYTFEEVIGQNPRFLKSDKTPPSLHQELWETISSGRVWKAEMINRIKSGEEIWEAVSISPITEENSEITHYVAIKEDITEKKEAEAEIKASIERFTALFEKSEDAYLILDGEHFTNCNQAAVDMLRYQDTNEILALTPGQLSPELQPDGRNSKEKAEEMVATAFEMGGHRFDWDHITKDGTIVPMEVILTPIKLEGRQVLLVVWHDLTERKKVEEEIRDAKNIAEEAAIELQEKFDQLSRFRRMATGRELMMVELKKEINELLRDSGQTDKYKIMSTQKKV